MSTIVSFINYLMPKPGLLMRGFVRYKCDARHLSKFPFSFTFRCLAIPCFENARPLFVPNLPLFCLQIDFSCIVRIELIELIRIIVHVTTMKNNVHGVAAEH